MTVRSPQVERAYSSRADETADATSGAVSRVGKARERIQGWKCVSVTRLVSCLGWLQCVERARGGRGREKGGWRGRDEDGKWKEWTSVVGCAGNWAKREYETRLMQQSNSVSTGSKEIVIVEGLCQG